MRVFGWSDLHVDYGANFKLLGQLSQHDFQDDVLLLAGDVSSHLDRLTRALRELKERFAEVAFVPGNHDLWIAAGERGDSLGKLHDLRTRARDLGIRMEPFTCRAGNRLVQVIPLLSWYLKPEEGEGSLYLAKPGEDPDLRMWADNFRIKWPALSAAQSPAEHLLSLNTSESTDASAKPSEIPLTTLTFSHFLPRVELVFSDWERFKTKGVSSGDDRAPEFNFTRVAGCRQLDVLLRQRGATIHLYGHQHRNRNRVIDGVRYLSHCLGYPVEWSMPDPTPSRTLPLEIQLEG